MMIKNWLDEMEQKYEVDILFAVENGSRAWGGATPQSDYDIRFIYKHKDLRSYLSLNKVKETIDHRIPYDVHGWDLFKAFHLLEGSNPSLFEMAFSPLVYRDIDVFSQRLQAFVKQYYSLFSLYQHYTSLFSRNIKEIEKKEWNARRQKQLIQAVRAFLLSKIIVLEKKVPMESVFSSFEHKMPTDEVVSFYKQLLQAKKSDILIDPKTVHDLLLLLEKEKQGLDNSAIKLPRRQNGQDQLNQWVWELLELEL